MIDNKWPIAISAGTNTSAVPADASIVSKFSKQLPPGSSGIVSVTFATSWGFSNSTNGHRYFTIWLNHPKNAFTPNNSASSDITTTGAWMCLFFSSVWTVQNTDLIVLTAYAWTDTGAANYYIDPGVATVTFTPFTR